MKRKWAVWLLILVLTTACLGGVIAHAEKEDSPITMTIEPDPDCQLTEAGEMTYLRFTLKNEGEEAYTLTRAVLSGELLSQALAFEEDIVIEPNEVKEFKVQKLSVPLSAFDRELTFTLSWQEVYYLEEDVEQLFPLYEEKELEGTVVIERFSEPVLELSYKTGEELVKVGEQVRITYILENNTKFDMTGLSLYDPSVSTGYIPLDSSELQAGERMEVVYTFDMGEVDVVVNPCVEYTVKGEKQLASCENTYTIRYLKVELKLDVQQYAATEDGTLFALTVTNSGTHAMKDIRLYDEIGTQVDEPFDLSAGQSKAITYTVAAAVSADSPRLVSFHATAEDYLKNSYTLEQGETFEVKPYVGAEQVNLQLIVTLANSKFNEDGSLLVRILFEVRNYSAVPITRGMLTENSAYNGTVREYEQLNQGVTTFYKDFTVEESTPVLSFILTAQDPAGNTYATEAMTMDMTSLLQKKQEESNASGNSQTIDITGTIYDTEKYTTLFRRILLVFFVLIVALLAGSAILFVYEQSILNALPPEREEVPTTTGKTQLGDTDVARLQLGYVQPAKLRYMAAVEQEREEAEKAPESLEEELPLVAARPSVEPVSATTMAFQRPIQPAEKPVEESAVEPVASEEEEDRMFRRPEPEPVFVPEIEPEPTEEPVLEVEPVEPEMEPEAEPIVEPEAESIVEQIVEEQELVLPPNVVEDSAEQPQEALEEELPCAPRTMELRPKPQIQPKLPSEIIRVKSGEWRVES